MIQLIFLGTSAGVPTKNRNLSSLALRLNGGSNWILFDVGEATQHQILKTPISLYKLDKIFITHLHGDHFYGLFGLIGSRAMIRATTPLTIYAPKGVRVAIETIFQVSGMNLPFELNIIELNKETTLEFDSFFIKAVKLSHSIECYGYIFIQKDRAGRFNVNRAKALGIRDVRLFKELQMGKSITLDSGKTITPNMVIDGVKRGKRVIIGGDNDKPEIFLRFSDIDLLIHEATYTQRDFDSLAKKFKHTTAKRLAEVANALKVDRLIATHISPRYDSDDRLRELEDEIRVYYKGDFAIAYDFMEVWV